MFTNKKKSENLKHISQTVITLNKFLTTIEHHPIGIHNYGTESVLVAIKKALILKKNKPIRKIIIKLYTAHYDITKLTKLITNIELFINFLKKSNILNFMFIWKEKLTLIDMKLIQQQLISIMHDVNITLEDSMTILIKNIHCQIPGYNQQLYNFG